MLEISVVLEETYDEETSEFDKVTFNLQFEHSLASISKWESKFETPFLDDKEKTREQTFWYVKAMCLTPNVPDAIFDKLTTDNFNAINEYINAKMTATWFNEIPDKKRINSERITSEVLYYYMTVSNIPFECDQWHLNRLLTLIRVCSIKNSPPKKRSKADLARERRELNEKRRAQMGTSG
jgi:hypothetical protein